MANYITYGSSFTSFNCSVEGLAFIAAHEAATGLTMGEVQKLAICGFVDRLKGNGTVNGSDIWTKAISRNARMWIHAPSNDSTISFSGCNVELFSQTTLGTFNNFVSGDLTVNGLKGGTGKYFYSGVSASNYPKNNFCFGVYSHTDNKSNSYYECGSTSSTKNQIAIRVADDRFQARVNFTTYLSNVSNLDSLGFYSVQAEPTRNGSSFKNGVLIDTGPAGRQIDTSDFIFHAYNINVSSLYSLRRLSIYFIGLPSLTIDEQLDFYEAVQWYQTNIITGGRNV